MRRIVNTAQRRKVISFLSKQSNSTLEWLERIGPEYIWILRHMYGPLGCTVSQMSEVSGWTFHVINPKRDQALYLLGMKVKITAEAKRTADIRLAEFQLRQRLVYRLQASELTPGDKEVVDLALRFGAVPSDITKHSSWSQQTLFHALGRLAGAEELQCNRPGDRVRQAALKELLKMKRNPKAELEAEILKNLDQETAIVDLAGAWGAEPTLLSAVIAEVRRELSINPRTRKRFVERNRKRSGKGEARGSLAIQALNAQLMDLYCDFRRANTPFSKSERNYLKLRSAGASIAVAGKSAFGVRPWRAMALDRAFLGTILPSQFVFPEYSELPLPPFTEAQQALQQQLKYVRL